MYSNDELDTCQICGARGTVALDLYGKNKFFHKIPSQRDGYFTFTETHQN